VSTFAIILGCIVFMIVVASVRGNPGRAIADMTLLVMLIGVVVALDFFFSRFIDTRYAANAIIITFAAGFALDALYGLMAPERQRQRDKKLRRLMKRRA
jgi:peptidoglycan/LPS O-acetylase OafA/YrhL